MTKLARDRGISIDRPVQSKMIGPFFVCSPSSEFFGQLVRGELNRLTDSLLGKLKKTARDFIKLVTADWFVDRLYHYPETSVCNESSTVLYAKLRDNVHILLTADAGIEALYRSERVLKEYHDFEAGSLSLIQIPHHGGRHNINSDILNRLLGSKRPKGSVNINNRVGVAIASVSRKAMDDENNHYPRSSVRNAFHTRGYTCCVTAGCQYCYYYNMPRRGWASVAPLPYCEYEEPLD